MSFEKPAIARSSDLASSAKRGRQKNRVDAHIAQRIRDLRFQRGISQQTLAQRVGLAYQQIQKYENGASRVAASTLFTLALELDVEPGYFYFGLDSRARSSACARRDAFATSLEGIRVIDALLNVPADIRESAIGMLSVAESFDGSGETAERLDEA